jgi:hypothetical protein
MDLFAIRVRLWFHTSCLINGFVCCIRVRVWLLWIGSVIDYWQEQTELLMRGNVIDGAVGMPFLFVIWYLVFLDSM